MFSFCRCTNFEVDDNEKRTLIKQKQGMLNNQKTKKTGDHEFDQYAEAFFKALLSQLNRYQRYAKDFGLRKSTIDEHLQNSKISFKKLA